MAQHDPEMQLALDIAHEILDECDDPDSDDAVLARQLIRSQDVRLIIEKDRNDLLAECKALHEELRRLRRLEENVMDGSLKGV
jgi:hypothetical protein